ncbi:MAG TPA: hypothetical protein VGG02_05055 [Chthoniobacterales bacterium]|jgi:hypothetical protein
MEARIILDDGLLKTLKRRLKTEKATDIIREALGLLDWATEEVGRDRVILSVGEEGEDPKRIETPGLRQARTHREVPAV